MNDQIMTIKEVSEYLKVHERTVYRLAGKNEIPAFKVANAWRFRKEDIDAWIKTQVEETLDNQNADDSTPPPTWSSTATFENLTIVLGNF